MVSKCCELNFGDSLLLFPLIGILSSSPVPWFSALGKFGQHTEWNSRNYPHNHPEITHTTIQRLHSQPYRDYTHNHTDIHSQPSRDYTHNHPELTLTTIQRFHLQPSTYYTHNHTEITLSTIQRLRLLPSKDYMQNHP